MLKCHTNNIFLHTLTFNSTYVWLVLTKMLLKQHNLQATYSCDFYLICSDVSTHVKYFKMHLPWKMPWFSWFFCQKLLKILIKILPKNYFQKIQSLCWHQQKSEPKDQGKHILRFKRHFAANFKSLKSANSHFLHWTYLINTTAYCCKSDIVSCKLL